MFRNHGKKWVRCGLWSALVALILVTLYPSIYLACRTVTVYGRDGIEFKYAGATHWYATSTKAAKELVVLKMVHADPAYSYGTLYFYSDTSQYFTPKDDPHMGWRMFRPLEHLEIRWRGRHEVVLTARELAEYTGQAPPVRHAISGP